MPYRWGVGVAHLRRVRKEYEKNSIGIVANPNPAIALDFGLRGVAETAVSSGAGICDAIGNEMERQDRLSGPHAIHDAAYNAHAVE